MNVETLSDSGQAADEPASMRESAPLGGGGALLLFYLSRSILPVLSVRCSTTWNFRKS